MDKESAIEILKEIIEEGWLISDMEKCTAIEACEMAIQAIEENERIKKDIEDLKRSQWFNDGKPARGKSKSNVVRSISYAARKEAIEVVEDLCIKNNMRKVEEELFNKLNPIGTVAISPELPSSIGPMSRFSTN